MLLQLHGSDNTKLQLCKQHQIYLNRKNKVTEVGLCTVAKGAATIVRVEDIVQR
jgi:hypothetical protein